MFGAREINSEFWMLNKYLSTDVTIALIVAIIGSTTVLLIIQKHLIQYLKRIISNPWRQTILYTLEIIAGVGLFSILLLSVIYLTANSYNPFIYFRF